VTLTLRGYIDLPPHARGGFDHEVIDGLVSRHLSTIAGCPEASGVLCTQDAGLEFAAARGAGKVLVIEARSTTVASEIMVGSRPNGLAWDPGRRRLLVADVQDMTVRLIDPASGSLLHRGPTKRRRKAASPDLSSLVQSNVVVV
jgi:DNA-binding beta-propeller fold protein YncE